MHYSRPDSPAFSPLNKKAFWCHFPQIQTANTRQRSNLQNAHFIYSRAIKTQHQNVHQYLKDIFDLLSQRIFDDFMKTKDKHHIGFISFNVKCLNVYTHAHFPTVV